jgi:hypothetical protein
VEDSGQLGIEFLALFSSLLRKGAVLLTGLGLEGLPDQKQFSELRALLNNWVHQDRKNEIVGSHFVTPKVESGLYMMECIVSVFRIQKHLHSFLSLV